MRVEAARNAQYCGQAHSVARENIAACQSGNLGTDSIDEKDVCDLPAECADDSTAIKL